MILLGFCVSSYNLSAILEAKSSLWLFYVKKWHQKSFLFSGIMLKKLMSKLHGENSSFFSEPALCHFIIWRCKKTITLIDSFSIEGDY